MRRFNSWDCELGVRMEILVEVQLIKRCLDDYFSFVSFLLHVLFAYLRYSVAGLMLPIM